MDSTVTGTRSPIKIAASSPLTATILGLAINAIWLLPSLADNSGWAKKEYDVPLGTWPICTFPSIPDSDFPCIESPELCNPGNDHCIPSSLA